MNKEQALHNLRPGASWVVKGEFEYDNIEWLDEGVAPPTRDEVEAEVSRILAEAPWIELRKKRDQLLAETDWWASSDRTMTAEQTAYRQALRDLPANTVDPENPVWPTKPE